MIDVIMDKRFFGRAYRSFNGVQLLRNFQTRAVRFHHVNDGPQVPVCALQAFYNFRVR